jgi:hypothetical protein
MMKHAPMNTIVSITSAIASLYIRAFDVPVLTFIT